MTDVVFVEILSKFLVPRANILFGSQWYLHQDNDPKHTSNLVPSFLQYNNITWVNVLIKKALINVKIKIIKAQSPSNSSDLNPIELMFADLKNFIASKMCKNSHEVREAIRLYEHNLDLQKIGNYIGHLQRVNLIKKIK